MKKILTLFFVAGGCILFFSRCNDLDLQPLDAITEDAFYQTASDFKGAILASYSSIQSFNGTSTENLGERAEWWKITLMATDDCTFDDVNVSDPATNINLDNLNFLPTDVAFQSLFTHIYQGIFRANLVLEKLQESNQLTPEEVMAFEAEAKFLRAWFHFQSYKLWGGQAPLALTTRRDINDVALPNSTEDATIEAILDDLQFAASNLPENWDSANIGRATAWAAKSYIGKVNLYAKRFPAALTALKDVYDNGPYNLMSNYEDVFSFDFENNAESIFELQYGSNSDDNGWVLDDNHTENFKASQGIMRAWWQDASGSRGAPGGGLGIYVPTTELINAFESGDPRRFTNIYQEGETYYAVGVAQPYEGVWSPTGGTMRKYRGENVAKMNPVNFAIDYNNERYFRFADLILMYAEAIIETGGDLGTATTLINEVRGRSFPDGTPIAGGLSAADLTTALRQERRVELAFEGHRLFDLVRWGIAEEVFQAQGKTFSMTGVGAIFPLPQSEIDRSGGVLSQVK
ncbi:MAG: RagB/SusD family nutrient uptake outer membrane protein [Bacteroidota bacterium]